MGETRGILGIVAMGFDKKQRQRQIIGFLIIARGRSQLKFNLTVDGSRWFVVTQPSLRRPQIDRRCVCTHHIYAHL